MKIGLFVDAYLPDINGVVTSVASLKDVLEKNGHEVFVVCPQGSFSTSYSDHVLRLPGLALKQLYGYKATTPFHSKEAQLIHSWNLDLIHAHTEFGVGIFARLVANKYHIPLVSTYHTTYEDYTHYVNLIHAKFVDSLAKKAVAHLSKMYGETCVEIISPSQKTKDMLIRYGIKKPITVVPTGIDLTRFKEPSPKEMILEIREQARVKDSDTAIVFVGRIAQEKSIDLVIDAFALLKKQNISDIKLVIVGDGPSKVELEKQAESLGVSETVIFLGKKPSDQIHHYYHAFDAFVSASTTETQGLTFIEALASGLPVYARRDEVLFDLVIPAQTGSYFDTPKELAEALIDYHSLGKGAQKNMSEAAMQAAKPYDSEIFYQKIIEVYQRVYASYHSEYIVSEIHYKNDAVLLKVENQAESRKVLISIDDFAKEGIRKDKVVTKKQLARLEKMQTVLEAYQKCVRKLSFKDYTRKEIYDTLMKNQELNLTQVNQLVEELEAKGYINDRRMLEAQLMNLSALLQGKSKIRHQLVKRGIPAHLVDEQLAKSDPDDELLAAINYAQKVSGSVKKRSLRYQINYLKQKLYAQGFDKNTSEAAIESLHLDADVKREIISLRTQALKAKNRFAKRFGGSELRNRLYRFLVMQGYNNDDIYYVLNEMEYNDDE